MSSPWHLGGGTPLLIAALMLSSGCSGDGQPEDTRVMVRSIVVEPVESGSSETSAAYAGVITSSFESDLAFRVPGRIVSRRVAVGDAVSRGSALATLDPAPFQTASRSAEAAVAAARAELTQAENDVARNASLAADRIVAAADMARYETQRDAAAARLKDAQARAAGARDDLSYAALRSPIDGVVTSVTAEVGQYLAPGQVAFRVARPGTLDAVVDVPESAIAGLRPGQAARVQLASGDGQPLAGTIREIAPAADPASRTYRVKVALSSPASARIGMTARVSFTSQPSTSTDQQIFFRVPRAAIIQDDKRRPAVWVIADKGKIALRPVALGQMAGTDVTITSGLRRGERIVTAGVHRLDAGQVVRLWDGRLP